jgi:hypothetical protein
MSYQSYFADPGGLWRFYVRQHPSGAPILTTDPLTSRMRDRPFPGFPSGQETCDCTLDPSGYWSTCGWESFPPWGSYVPGGDGGDIAIVTTDGYAKLPATQDGSQPTLYYFVGPGLGQPGNGEVGGWLSAGPDAASDTWNAAVCYLQQSDATPYAPLGNLSQSYTRYLIATIPITFWRNSALPYTLDVECLVSEHYDGADPSTALNCERFVYGDGWGKLIWEIWEQPGAAVAPTVAQADGTPYCSPTPPLTAGLVMTDCRYWTNIIPYPVPSRAIYRVSACGWPQNFVLP